MRRRWPPLVLMLAPTLFSFGCGRFIAERLVQAPNTYPDWIKHRVPVELDFGTLRITNFSARAVTVGPPRAELSYRVVEPRDYQLKFTSTHWTQRGKPWFRFSFHTEWPGVRTDHTDAPRGTVVLLHGYSLNHRRMLPWALKLAQEGYRCVLPDLRGHGRSTGQKVHFGIVEARDLTQMLEALERGGQLQEPVAVLGESFGASLALRWRAIEPRVRTVVAMAPYAELSSAVLNIRKHHASLLPECVLRAGLDALPEVLQTEAQELNLRTVMQRARVSALLVAGAEDVVTPPAEAQQLEALGAPPTKLIVVPGATHEAVPYFFAELASPVLSWLDQTMKASSAEADSRMPPASANPPATVATSEPARPEASRP